MKARCAGILAVATSAVLESLYEAFRHEIKVDSTFEGSVAGALATVVANTPLLLLFIALAIVSMSRVEAQEPLADETATEGGITP